MRSLMTLKLEKERSNNKRSNQYQNKALFPYGDWLTVVLGVIILSKTDGMGHHLGHGSLFFLMLALIARPISFLWNQPLKYRRTIGILSFATALAHSIYAYSHILNNDLAKILTMSPGHQWGMWAGIISLAAITPAAMTSFQYLQKKLGKRWRQIHLLTVPALAFAVLHVVLIGPHYLGKVPVTVLNYGCTYGIITIAAIVFLIRKRSFWSILGFKKMSK